MSIMSAVVLYVVIWTMVFFVLNPLWQVSQSEDGEIVPGTPSSAPVNAMVARKAIIATVVGSVLFALTYSAIVLGWFSLDAIRVLTLPSQR